MVVTTDRNFKYPPDFGATTPEKTPGPVATRKEQEIGIRGEESGKM